jgi:membrane-associated phospholipid phosphatase
MVKTVKKSFWDEGRSQTSGLFRGAGRFFRRYSFWLALSLVVVCLVSFFLFRLDNNLLLDLQACWSGPKATATAQALSYWGDYPTGTLILVVSLWLCGALFHRPQWQRAALACLLAASCAGLLNNSFRFTVGRPRPLAHLPDGVYGPSISYRMNSFPSGHSATSAATAVSLLIALPPAGIPVCLGSAGVIWSRMELDCHHPSDVLFGAYFGIVFGLAFGCAARRMERNRSS